MLEDIEYGRRTYSKLKSLKSDSSQYSRLKENNPLKYAKLLKNSPELDILSKEYTKSIKALQYFFEPKSDTAYLQNMLKQLQKIFQSLAFPNFVQDPSGTHYESIKKLLPQAAKKPISCPEHRNQYSTDV
ncbi:hypothetical protein [Holospora curviuscula]|uniref:Uncharacterized protein n=1 Tax=Holospora curviuscula TaxID=1082868 RepID=A0A2S5R7A8_9PROT|nr:hypothetical protein [Holospora curviuscula]PPE03226.1 hypothetical protein HCUR_01333 [Holospora curviuscula]